MKKKWEEIKVQNLRAKEIERKVYEQMLKEVARMIYDEVCQLHQNSNLGSLTLEDQFLQRTGTDA
jgi:ribosomal protein S25